MLKIECFGCMASVPVPIQCDNRDDLPAKRVAVLLRAYDEGWRPHCGQTLCGSCYRLISVPEAQLPSVALPVAVVTQTPGGASVVAEPPPVKTMQWSEDGADTSFGSPKPAKPLHWKTREKLAREAAEAQIPT